MRTIQSHADAANFYCCNFSKLIVLCYIAYIVTKTCRLVGEKVNIIAFSPKESHKWPTTKETKEKTLRCYESGVCGTQLQFFFVPLKNIRQNESPNDKENLESDGEKTTLNIKGKFKVMLLFTINFRICNE